MAQLAEVQVTLALFTARRTVKRALAAVEEANRALAQTEELVDDLKQTLRGYGINLVLDEEEKA